jgi:hypothetical protein
MTFLSPDPLVPFGGAGYSLYSYCRGDPINAADPSGLSSVLPSMHPWVSFGFAAADLTLSSILFGCALLAISGGAALPVFLALGAGIGVVSAVAGLTSASLTLVDADRHADRISLLNRISVGTGAVSLGVSIGSAARAGVRLSATLGRGAAAGFLQTGAGTHAWRGTRYGGSTFFGLTSDIATERRITLPSIAIGLINMAYGIDMIRGELSTTAPQGLLLPAPDDPARAHRPVVAPFEDPIAALSRFESEVEQQIARIRRSPRIELYDDPA